MNMQYFCKAMAFAVLLLVSLTSIFFLTLQSLKDLPQARRAPRDNLANHLDQIAIVSSSAIAFQEKSSQFDARIWMATQASHALAAVPLADKILINSSEKRDSSTDGSLRILGDATIWDLFVPTLTCPEVERVGNFGDGGKWVCGLESLTEDIPTASSANDPSCVMYSFGISTDISFEMEILMRTPCYIFAFDPTIGSLPLDLLPLGALKKASDDKSFRERIVFHKVALGARSGSSAYHALNEALPDIMARLGHSYVDLVKIDIEGSEWDVFGSLQQRSKVSGSANFLPVGQLFIELHFSSLSLVRNFFDFMTASGLVPFSREINLLPTLVGKKPKASEYSFINPTRFFKLNASAHVSAAPPVMVANAKARSGPKAVIYIHFSKSRRKQVGKALGFLYNNSWKHYPFYPVVLFHDEHVENAEREFIQASVPKMTLTFAHVNFFMIPDRTECAPKRSTVRSRHATRFHAYDVYRYLNKLGFLDLEYVWRLDDNSMITSPIGYDVFQFMETNHLKYGFVSTVEDNAKCLAGLWRSARSFAGKLSTLHNESFLVDWPDSLMVSNHFEISHMSLWKSSLWRDFMKHVDELGGSYMTTRGGTPLHTIGVSMMLSKREIHKFSDIGYFKYPFVNQTARGLSKPHAEDPFNPERCTYYDSWRC